MRNTYTSKQTSKRSMYTFCRFVWNFFYINKQNTFRCTNKRIQNKTIISTTTNTYGESQHKTNASPTAPQ